MNTLAAGLALAVFAMSLALGGVSSLRFRRIVGWGCLVGSVAAMESATRESHPVARMLWLIGVLFWSMKGIVYAEWREGHPAGLPWTRRLAFWLMWPGMRPDVFAGVGRAPASGDRGENRTLLRKGLIGIVSGFVCLQGAALLRSGSESASPAVDWLTMLPALVGLSLMLHFGLFNLIAGFWRGLGFGAYELFRSPLRARSLEEFWGRRWNLAFTEMTAWSVFRPLKHRLGIRIAGCAAFLVSGALHEVAITLPVGMCYGLPTLYFVLQWVGIGVEQRWFAKDKAPTGPRRGWAMLCVIVPLPLVFPPPFVSGICEPVMRWLTWG